MKWINCSNCGSDYPDIGVPYRCTVCGGVYDMPRIPGYIPEIIDPGQPGIWRYRHTFGLEEAAQPISLGEGSTPLVWAEAQGRNVAFKIEFMNPSGSYKDRGSAILTSFLKGRGVSAVVEDSSGNAGASFAAYAARSGIQVKIFIPDEASGPKRQQIQAYGAEIVRIIGPRSYAAEAVQKAAAGGAAYASHAYLPQVLGGYATIAFELFEQLGQAPGTIVLPVGQGNLLLAIGRGFVSLRQAGLIDRIPVIVGVQARACAPLWAVFHYGSAGMIWVGEGESLAEGVRVKHPIRGDAVLKVLKEHKGWMLAVDESKILSGRDQLAQLGLYVEPTSAIIWDALAQLPEDSPTPLVAILTGSGLKFAE